MGDRKSIQVEVTKEMIGAGIGEYLDYTVGGMNSGDMVKNVFTAMLAVSPLCCMPESKGPALHRVEPLDSPQNVEKVSNLAAPYVPNGACGLPPYSPKGYIVLPFARSREWGAGSPCACEEYGNGYAANVADSMRRNGAG